MIYREDVSYAKTVREPTRDVKNDYRRNLGGDIKNIVDSDRSFDSGNLFESLAKSNPEKFNKLKLKELLESKNIVEDFNKYLDNIFKEEYVNMLNTLYSNINDATAIHKKHNTIMLIMYEQINILKQNGLSEDEIKRAITETFIPDINTEEGCKALIMARLEHSKIVTEQLTTMVKQNYTALGLSQAEASALLGELSSDASNSEAISKVQKLMDDPSIISKYRKGTNYDFRPIGGAFVMMCDDNAMQLSQRPSKNLVNIFKYDAIVCSHGNVEEDNISDAKTAQNIKEIKELANSISEGLDSGSETNFKFLIKPLYGIFGNISKDGNKIKDVYNKLNLAPSKQQIVLQNDNIIKLWKSFLAKIHSLSDLYRSSGSKEDGQSRNWVVQPIDTLSASNLTRTVDIVRQLKKEGFKNIFLMACNPGHVELPDDIKNDKNFHVRMGTEYIYLESSYEDNIYDELILEACGLNDVDQVIDEAALLEQEILNEISLDKIKEIAIKAAKTVANLFIDAIKFVGKLIMAIVNFCKTHIIDKIKDKFKKPVKTAMIEIDSSGKAVYREVSVTDGSELEKVTSKASETIKQYLSKKQRMEDQFSSNIEKKINQIQKEKAMKANESSIFESVVLM